MKTILFTMASLSALAIAAPAAAQYPNQGAYPPPRGFPSQGYDDQNFAARIARLEARLEAGVRQRTITGREAWPLRMHIRDLTRIERLYSRDGLSRRERAELETRVRDLRQRIRLADGSGYDRFDRDGDGGDDRYDRNRDGGDDRYDRNLDGDDDRFDRDNDGDDDRFDRNDDDRDDRFDRNADGRDDRFDGNADGVDDRYDRNRDGWDDRDLDRDGRWEDDSVGVGVGVGLGLRVGQRASPDLSAVPYEYRSQYRDGNGSYYRSDGRAIYQIDVRTNTVVRVYPIDR